MVIIFFFTKYMAKDDFSEPPRRANSHNSIFIFLPNFGPGHLWAQGSVSPSIEGGV